MPFKTITIDLEAYQRLSRVKRPNESFSATIKRVVREPFDPDRLIRMVRKLSPGAVDAIERQVSNRSRPSRRRR